ncbi:uncharacterized protein LOC110973721 [Acanthaster planci]|uniref:Uncharacterized protein LOC110973721 n=1 Tax=Acanthaster planci TaxID=133434 RepID=A0A8B7XI17_ACAPL|nr:uncharacterized protein LOC110973721 [Acanthaster planci]
MWSGLLVCMLVVGAMAFQPSVPFGASQPGERHEPCCAPRYFTFNQVTTTTSVQDGSLLVEYDNAEGAYDAKFERIAVKLVIDYFNGTEVYLRLIEDYIKGVSYYILEHAGEDICFVGRTEGRFNEECLNDDAQFLSEATLGDYDLVLDNWYVVSEDKTEHSVKSVQHEGCVPVGLLTRTFDPDTGKELKVDDSRVLDFKLGICDPDKYFKPPASCDEGRAVDKPTPQMLKYRRKGLFRRSISE